MGENICPHCKKPVYDDEALLCLYCGESLQRSCGFISSMKYSPKKIAVVSALLLVLLAFILLVTR
jgi:hypothetical protein